MQLGHHDDHWNYSGTMLLRVRRLVSNATHYSILLGNKYYEAAKQAYVLKNVLLVLN